MSSSVSPPAPPPSPVHQTPLRKRPHDFDAEDFDADPFKFNDNLDTFNNSEETFNLLSKLNDPKAIADALSAIDTPCDPWGWPKEDHSPPTKKQRNYSPGPPLDSPCQTPTLPLNLEEAELADNITPSPTTTTTTAYITMYPLLGSNKDDGLYYLWPIPSHQVIEECFDGCEASSESPPLTLYEEPGFCTTYESLIKALARGLVHKEGMTCSDSGPSDMGRHITIISKPKHFPGERYMHYVYASDLEPSMPDCVKEGFIVDELHKVICDPEAGELRAYPMFAKPFPGKEFTSGQRNPTSLF